MFKKLVSVILCAVMLTGTISVSGSVSAGAYSYGSYELQTIKVGEPYVTGYTNMVSQNTKVVTISSDGVARGVAPGKAMVGYSYSYGDFVPVIEFTVSKANVKMSRSSLKTTVGSKKFIYLNDAWEGVSWKSSKPKVASVELGKITAKKAGKATVSAIYKGKSYKCSVTVVSGKTALNYKKLSLSQGGSVKLKLLNAGGKVKWKSSSKKVTVSSKGNVSAKKKGKATVTAKLGKKKYKCKVTVKAPAAVKIKFSKTAAVEKGGRLKLKLKGNYSFSSSKKSVATVKKGTVTGKKTGTATITAKKGKKKLKCRLTVFASKKAAVKTITNTNNSASFKGGVKVLVDPALVKSEAQVSVSKLSGLPKLNGVRMKAYDFSLKGAKVSSANVAVIEIPQKVGKNEIPLAAYFNKKKNRWERALCSYSGGKISMVVNHFSPYAVGKVKGASFGILDENTTQESVYSYWAPPEATISGERALQIIKGAANANKPTKSCNEIGCEALKWLFEKVDWTFDKATNFYANLTGALVPAHLQDAFSTYANNFADHIGLIGFALSMIKGIRYVYEGKRYEAAGAFLSGINGLATAYMAKWVGTAGLSAGLFASACIGYALNKVYESALADNEKRWYKVYTGYYEKGADGYMHLWQWRDKLAPILGNSKLTQTEVQSKIADVVNAYADEAWNSPWFPAYFYKATGAATTFAGGLSKAIKTKLSNQKKFEVYTKVIPVVMEWFAKKQADAVEDTVRKSSDYIASLLSKELTTNFYDGSRKSGKKSALKGWTVKWKNIPSNIKDKKNLKVKLDIFGMGKIDFTLYASLKHKFGNKVQVCNKKGKVIDTIIIKNQKIPKTNVNVMTKKVEQYLKSQKRELNKTKLTLNKGKSFTLKLSNAKASKIKWSTSNKKIATVKNGKVKALKKGKATITAKYKGKSYKCKVTVKVKSHYWKLVSTTEKNINYSNFKSSGEDYYDTTPKNPEPNTLYVLDTYHWNATINAVGSKGAFSVNHTATSDKAWSKEHSGKCSVNFKAVCAVDTPKEKYKAGESLDLKMAAKASHGSCTCLGFCNVNLFVNSSYINPVLDANGIPKYSNGHDGFSISSGSKTAKATDSYAPAVSNGKKGNVFYIVVGVSSSTKNQCCTVYKYQWT